MNIELSAQAFHEAWKHFGLGSKPIALNVLPQGVLESERRAAAQQGWDELRQHGFGDRDREDDLYGLFAPLRRYERAYDINFRYRTGTGEHQRTGLVANVRNYAVLGVLAGDRVRVLDLPSDAMIRALLDVLPEVRPGAGKAVSLRSKQLDTAALAAGESNNAMANGLISQGVRRDEAGALVDMAGTQRTASAQFGASIMDGRGHRTRAPMVTNCFANANGWYMLEENNRGAEPWVTIAPIDKNRLGARVRDLVKTIAVS